MILYNKSGYFLDKSFIRRFIEHKIYTFCIIMILFMGLSLFLYPIISGLLNISASDRVILTYSNAVSKLDMQSYDSILNSAQNYNYSMIEQNFGNLMADDMFFDYDHLLNVDNSGVMGYIEIPAINVLLPIYHGTDEKVMQIGIGHLEWSSLPVGGVGSHCVLTGHRGLPSARLFTDLDKIAEGDIFSLRVLNEFLFYEVDLISIVEPHQTDNLLIQPGFDLCTLVTCTPYGVNTHRLLVRGHRVTDPARISITLDTLHNDYG